METQHSSQTVVQLPVASIVQDKAIQNIPLMSDSDFQRLCISVAEKGIQDPLWLREDGGKLVLVNGRNRLNAAMKLKQATVPCIVKPSENPLADALDSAFARRNLSKTGMAYTLFKVYPAIADRDDLHNSSTSFNKGSTGVHKMDANHDKGLTIRSLSEKHGLHRNYLCAVIEVMKACRPKSNDDEKVAHMILEEGVGHANLLKGLLGWQASHPIGDAADPKTGKTAKKAPVNVLDGFKRSLTFIRNQAQSWDKIKQADKADLLDQFARTWVLLPPDLQLYALKQGKTKDYAAALAREAELAKPIGPKNPIKKRIVEA